MRGLGAGLGLAALAAASMAGARLQAAEMSVGMPAMTLPHAPRITGAKDGKKRVPVATANGRRIGRRLDPYYGIASKGRNGARAGAAEVAAAMPKRFPRGRTNPKAKDLLARLAREAKRRAV